jgi:hypothetical protein
MEDMEVTGSLSEKQRMKAVKDVTRDQWPSSVSRRCSGVIVE